MKTDNELIAEFMDEGFIREKNWHRDHWKDMPFDTSWDWLMPVVEKIESLGHYVMIGTGDVEIGNDDVPVDVCYEDGDTKIKLVYLAVVEFIKWYNSTLK